MSDTTRRRPMLTVDVPEEPPVLTPSATTVLRRLLLDELARRPRRATSVESIGLAS